MTNSADPDQLASKEANWIYTVCKGRVYRGPVGQRLKKYFYRWFIKYSGVFWPYTGQVDSGRGHEYNEE